MNGHFPIVQIIHLHEAAAAMVVQAANTQIASLHDHFSYSVIKLSPVVIADMLEMLFSA